MAKKVLPFITLLCVAVMVVAVSMIVGEVKDSQEAINDFDELAELITDYPVSDESESTTEPKNSDAEPEATEPPTVFTRNLTPLFEKNADCIGWVYIKDTAVDYPVMHTPSEPQRYLRLNFDKEYSTAGVPFLKGKWDLDGTTAYEFSGDGNGALLLPNVTYEFTYEIKKDQISIDYENESVRDGTYTFTVEDNTLTLIGGEGTAEVGKVYELTLVKE